MEEIAKFFDGDDTVGVSQAALADVKERGAGGSIGEKNVAVEHIKVSK
jgi:hypothetical protein